LKASGKTRADKEGHAEKTYVDQPFTAKRPEKNRGNVKKKDVRKVLAAQIAVQGRLRTCDSCLALQRESRSLLKKS